jgi:hypothetical protein
VVYAAPSPSPAQQQTIVLTFSQAVDSTVTVTPSVTPSSGLTLSGSCVAATGNTVHDVPVVVTLVSLMLRTHRYNM